MIRFHRHSAGSSDSGQVIVLLAVAMLFFMALLVVVGDTAFVWMQKRDLQNTADAAALAGAQELNGAEASEGPAIAAAEAWADKNISDLASFDAVVIDNYTKIRVTVRKNSGSLFSGWLSFGNPEVSAKAAARIASMDIAPCVVPLGVQHSFYQAGIQNPEELVTLRLNVGDSLATSNTGMLNLGTGSLAGPVARGYCALEPEVKLAPGQRIGQIRQGMGQRLSAAIANNCFTEAEVKADLARCKPPVLTDGSVQATALLLLPVLATDISQPGASEEYPLMLNPNGTYMLAYFWVDGHATFNNLPHDNPTCKTGNDDCTIFGKWVLDVPVDLTVFNQSHCPPNRRNCIIDFDESSAVKIVMMDE